MGGEPAQPTTFASKAAMMEYVIAQLDAVVCPSPTVDPAMNLVLSLGNVASLLFYAYNAWAESAAQLQSLPINWVGFYLMTGPQTLVLGPFQGRVACTKIKVGRGVCGAAVLQRKSLVVPNVHDFPNHIACDGDSNAEVVVPLRATKTDGRIVGVLDVDSTRVNQFDDTDRVFLEQVVAVLGERLEFPFCPPNRVLGAADAAPPKAAATPPGATLPQHATSAESHIPSPPPTQHRPAVVHALPPDHALPPQVHPRLETIHGWEFQMTEEGRIHSQAEQHDLETTLRVHAIPEITFPANGLRLVEPGGTMALHFDSFSVLKDAARFYQTEGCRALAAADIAIPKSDAWAKSKYAQFDAKIDWAWRHRYFGFDGDVATGTEASPSSGAAGTATDGAQRLLPNLVAVRDETALIDWDLLKRTDLPILFFGSLPLFEDDLHDNGVVLCTLKFRVMDSCFFILLRHIVHVHGAGTSVRDVRLFHRFGDTVAATTGGRASFPRIVVEEQFRREQTAPTPSAAPPGVPPANHHPGSTPMWSLETADALVPKLPLLETIHYRLALQPTTTSSAAGTS